VPFHGNGVTQSRTPRSHQLDGDELDEYLSRIRITYYRKRVSQPPLFASQRGRRLLSQKIVVAIVLMFAIALTLLTAPYASPIQVRAAGPVYQTDLEGVVQSGGSGMSGFGLPYYFDFAGGDFWIEGQSKQTPGVTCHSGSRCLGLEVASPSSSAYRSQLDAYPQLAGIVSNEYYYSTWVYLPADFNLKWLGTYNWFSMGVLFYDASAFTNKLEVMIANTDSSRTAWNAQLEYVPPDSYGGQGNRTFYVYHNFPLPLGRWFQMEWYLKINSGWNSHAIVWLDHTKIADVSNLLLTPEYASSRGTWYDTLAMIYFDGSQDSGAKKIWYDDMQISNTMPQTTTSTTSTTTSSVSSTSSASSLQTVTSLGTTITSTLAPPVIATTMTGARPHLPLGFTH
jgi:hypothetical protein